MTGSEVERFRAAFREEQRQHHNSANLEWEQRKRAEAAEAKLAAVEALHRQWEANQATVCHECGDDWPCPTIEALR